MDKIITAIALSFNSILLVLIIMSMTFGKERLPMRYYVISMIYTMINMIAILYGGQIA